MEKDYDTKIFSVYFLPKKMSLWKTKQFTIHVTSSSNDETIHFMTHLLAKLCLANIASWCKGIPHQNSNIKTKFGITKAS